MAIPIRRYPNRKLYNPQTSQYIGLNELGDIIRQGEDIVVVDSVSGEDITGLVLTQVIMSQEKSKASTLPRAVLAGLIRSSMDTLDVVSLLLHSPMNTNNLTNALAIPTRDDLIMLNGRIDMLSQEVEALVEQHKKDHQEIL